MNSVWEIIVLSNGVIINITGRFVCSLSSGAGGGGVGKNFDALLGSVCEVGRSRIFRMYKKSYNVFIFRFKGWCLCRLDWCVHKGKYPLCHTLTITLPPQCIPLQQSQTLIVWFSSSVERVIYAHFYTSLFLNHGLQRNCLLCSN